MSQTPQPELSVVLLHYQQQRLLDLALAALSRQVGAPSFEVVVADDGSPDRPSVHQLPAARVVRHEDLGFRIAAARNLGAQAATGRHLVFLDGDCIPFPSFLASVGASDELVVGRRLHVDTADWMPTSLPASAEESGPLLDAPSWLADGYRATNDLQDADDASFRFVIGAVMSLPREDFLELGGFDEQFVGYGGEDWELAHRWWCSGRPLRHRAQATVWHHGADLVGRTESWRETKNLETARLAEMIPHPLVRGPFLRHDRPHTVVCLDARNCTPSQVVLAVEAWLELGDVSVFVDGSEVPQECRHDPRVQPDPPDPSQLRSCLRLVRAVASGRPRELAADVASASQSTPARWVSSHEANRAKRSGTPVPWQRIDPAAWEPLPADVVVEHDRTRRWAEADRSRRGHR